MFATIVTSDKELHQIVALSQTNNKQNTSAIEKYEQGFISWQYSIELLQQMHSLQPSVIVKDGEKLAGYALVALKEASSFHKDLAGLITNLENINYKGKQLSSYNYYVMGQVCVDTAYRGKGVFAMLYQHHKLLFKDSFDFVVTEISLKNTRSIRAHEKVGFREIYKYQDAVDDWSVVLWNWD